MWNELWWNPICPDVKKYEGLNIDVEELPLRSEQTQERMERDGDARIEYIDLREDFLTVMKDLSKLIELQKYINMEKSERWDAGKPDACDNDDFQSNPAFQAFRHLWVEAEEEEKEKEYYRSTHGWGDSSSSDSREDQSIDNNEVKSYSYKEEEEDDEATHEEEKPEQYEEVITKKESENPF